MLSVFASLALCHSGLHPVGQAQAHPGTSQLGQRFELTLTRSSADAVQVDLEYVAELPAVRVYAEARPVTLAPDALPTPEMVQAWSARRLEELRDGVRMSWESAALPLSAGTKPDAVLEADGGFIELHVYRSALAPADSGTLQIHDGNFPDEGGYYATTVTLSGDLIVAATSLCAVKDGLLHKNRHGAWIRDDSARETTLTIRPASLWERRSGALLLPERMAGLTSLAPPVDAMLGVLAGLGAVLLLLGLYARRRARSEPST